jgi:hypothetical protein
MMVLYDPAWTRSLQTLTEAWNYAKSDYYLFVMNETVKHVNPEKLKITLSRLFQPWNSS